MLADWGAEPWLVDAGRLHAAYGTDGFPHPLPGATPEKVVATVGARSERLIDLYCHCRRSDSYPTFLGAAPAVIDRRDGARHRLDRVQLRAFAELTVANELDVLAHAPDLQERHGPALAKLLASWRPLVGQQTRAAIDGWIREAPAAKGLRTLGLQRMADLQAVRHAYSIDGLPAMEGLGADDTARQRPSA